MEILPYSTLTTNVLITVKNSSGVLTTGLIHNSAGLSISYRKNNESSYTSITLVDGTLGSYTSGGFKEDGGGLYQLGLPTGAINPGNSVNIKVTYDGATNFPQIFSFTGADQQVSNRLFSSNPFVNVSTYGEVQAQIPSWNIVDYGVIDDPINDGSITATTVTVEDGSIFRAGDLIRVSGLTEIMRVSGVSSNDLTIVRGVLGTAVKGLVDGGYLIIHSRAYFDVDDIVSGMVAEGPSFTINSGFNTGNGILNLVWGDTYEDEAYDRGKISIPIPIATYVLSGGDQVDITFSKNKSNYTQAFSVSGTVVNAGLSNQAVEFIISETNAQLLDKPTVQSGSVGILSGFFDIQLTRDTDNKTTLYVGDYYLSKSLTP